MPQTCGNCRYAVTVAYPQIEGGNANAIECHCLTPANPPNPPWREVKATDWCGRWKVEEELTSEMLAAGKTEIEKYGVASDQSQAAATAVFNAMAAAS